MNADEHEYSTSKTPRHEGDLSSKDSVNSAAKKKGFVLAPAHGTQGILTCPAHGRNVVNYREAAATVAARGNPCPECQALPRIENRESRVEDKYAQKHKGWRILCKPRPEPDPYPGAPDLSRPILESEIFTGPEARQFVSISPDTRDAVYFPNRLEANEYRILLEMKRMGKIVDFEYQPAAFDFRPFGKDRGVTQYRPDFKVIGHGPVAAERPSMQIYYIEMKGWMDPRSLTRLRAMARHYPAVQMQIITSRRVIERWVRKFPADWQWTAWGGMTQLWKGMCPGWEG